MVWSKSIVHVLEGTGIELHPEYGSDLWFVMNTNGKERVLSCALPLRQAKASAERHARRLAKERLDGE